MKKEYFLKPCQHDLKRITPLHDAKVRYALCLIFCFAPLFVSSGNAASAKDPKILFDQGLKLLEAGNLTTAERKFLMTVKYSFGHYPSYYNLALIALRDKNYAKALKYLDSAQKFNPYDQRLSAMQSTAHIRTKTFTDAKKELENIIAKTPTDIIAHKKLGIIFLLENDANSALSEFTLLKNLTPSDLQTNLLLSAGYALTHDLDAALEKIDPFKESLTSEPGSSFYRSLLELQAQTEQKTPSAAANAVTIFATSLMDAIIDPEIDSLQPESLFDNPEITQRIAERIQTEEKYAPVDSIPDKQTAARPLNWKGTLTETFELYARAPKASNPINALNSTTNVVLEGKHKDVNLKAEFEGYFNRWDNNRLDFYKLNANKTDDFEIDIGKFSAKYFATLISHPTVEEGIRVWKKWELPPYRAEPAPVISSSSGEDPINIGEIYNKYSVDNRQFQDIEVTMLSGKTRKPISVGDRKEKNENTTETSGQFEQWTHAYRLHSKVNEVLGLGATAAFTEDQVDSTVVTSTVNPISSSAVGLDGDIDLLDNNLKLDGEIAFSNYDEDTEDDTVKSLRDAAWLLKSEYIAIDSVTLGYEYKTIGRHFKIEGASQTQDRSTHTVDVVYKPKDPKTWSIQSQTFKFIPEIENEDGHGDEKKSYRTFQSVSDCKLPKDIKYIFDYKYYREKDKCGCTDYTTLTFKNTLDWNIPGLNTTIKPSYTFERKNDMLILATDEKLKEYAITLENTSFKDWKLSYSFELERKTYNGATTKSYTQYIHSLEAKYIFAPSRLDVDFKLSRDLKIPTDTNKTDIMTAALELNYTSQSGDDKVSFKYERKNNIYRPWSDSSAYRQNYLTLKYARRF